MEIQTLKIDQRACSLLTSDFNDLPGKYAGFFNVAGVGLIQCDITHFYPSHSLGIPGFNIESVRCLLNSTWAAKGLFLLCFFEPSAETCIKEKTHNSQDCCRCDNNPFCPSFRPPENGQYDDCSSKQKATET